jgi:hypothetical protein
METVTGAATQHHEPESHGRMGAGKAPGLAQTPPAGRPARGEPTGAGEGRACLTRMTRARQAALPDRITMPPLAGDGDIAPLWSLKLRPRFPALRRLRPG